ncbi:SDR family NAD(P)-dependent oxidoreductase [Curtobacterium flaccumfaciens]|nr:SDR family NAD(P)-dependent oxidoreductase [Curtobacterium flaccumfaciens]
MNEKSPAPASRGTRTVIITGGNSGLGYATAAAILSTPGGAPWQVIIGCRDPQRAQEAVDRLTALPGRTGSVRAMALDLASLASVREFADEVERRVREGSLPPVHAVVCNAGMQTGANQMTTVDGFESTFGVNHLGHFLLVTELLPSLEAPARAVVVASNTHDPAKKAGAPAPAWSSPRALARGELAPSPQTDSPFVAGGRRYTTSKLANVYFTYGLAARLPDGVSANAFDPGLMPGPA